MLTWTWDKEFLEMKSSTCITSSKDDMWIIWNGENKTLTINGIKSITLEYYIYEDTIALSETYDSGLIVIDMQNISNFRSIKFIYN